MTSVNRKVKSVNINVNKDSLSNYIPLIQKGQPNGVATLDGSGKVPLAQIPTIPVIAAGSNGQLQFNNAGGLAADSSLFWDNTNKRLGIGIAPISNTRLSIAGTDTNNNTFALQVHNATGNNNTLMVRNDGNVGIGTSAPQTTLHIRNSGAPQLRVDNGVNGGNGLSGSIQFTDTNTSFIAMNRTGGTSCIISIPPNNNTQDQSHLHIQYNNTGTGFYIFPRRSHDSLGNRTVFRTDGDQNNGNQSRGIDFINASSGNGLSYTLPAFRFYSSYKTAIDSYGLRLQINNVTQARANNNLNLAEIWGVNTLFGFTDNNTITIDNSAVLDIQSTNRGFLPPRMTTSNFNAIANKAAGLIAYSNDDNGLLFWDGTRITGFRYNGTKFQGYDGTAWNDLN